MNVLEKILEEIEKAENEYCHEEHSPMFCMGACSMAADVKEIIRSHMDEASDVCGKRLIDANALDDEVMNFFLSITGNPKQTTVVRECKESFRRMIDEQSTVYVDDGWIPVSERLPETDDYILISFDNTSIVDIGRYEKDEDGGGAFYPGDEDKSYSSIGIFVNAWRPLPEPYKEGEHD